MKSIFKLFASLFAVPVLLSAAPAYADDAAMAIFFTSVAVAQAETVKAQANFYDAIGYGAKAQQYTSLANSFKNGSFGGNEGVKTFVSAGDGLVNDIAELDYYGAPLDAAQREKARAAANQLEVAKVALVAALASGVVTVVHSKGGTLEKILLGAEVAIIVGQLSASINRASKAASSLTTLQIGKSGGFQPLSKEITPMFATL